MALTLLGWGGLVAVAATASAVRAVGSAESQGAAIAAARNRVEDLAARPCADLASGNASDVARGIRERWTVTRGRNGARLVTDSVAYSDRGAMRAGVLHRLIVC